MISLFLFTTVYSLLAAASGIRVMASPQQYTLAPVTDKMKSAADLIIKTMLPWLSTGNSNTVDTPLAWQRLAYITDTFGPRFSGSEVSCLTGHRLLPVLSLPAVYDLART